MRDLLDLVDEAVERRVIVFGSLPPAGRDLDLLAREPEERRLRAELDRHGLVRVGARHVRFVRCTAEVVDLVPAGAWHLPEQELEALFRDAVELAGRRRLSVPAPRHALLIEARKLARSGGVLKDRARRRLEAALADDPGVLESARRLAPHWRVATALELLDDALATRRRAPRRKLARAAAELASVSGATPWIAGARAALPTRPRRGALITLSGLDGSGKSSQTAALRDALERLGYDAVVEWSSLSQHPPFLHAVTAALERVLRRARLSAEPGADDGDRPATATLRERSGAVTFAWSTLVALTNALEQSRAVSRHLWRGRVVICDRYTLDSRVHLRYAYGEHRGFRLQAGMIELLSPKPDRAYLLDVSAETATARKQDYPLAENQRRARLYREERARVGAVAVDGDRAREEICSLIADDVRHVIAERRS